MNHFRSFLIRSTIFGSLLLALAVNAQDRTVTPEQQAAIAGQDESEQETEPKRPAKLPDLTKGDEIAEREPSNNWPLGPTGMFGYMVGGPRGDQIEVSSIASGSPADGVIERTNGSEPVTSTTRVVEMTAPKSSTTVRVTL